MIGLQDVGGRFRADRLVQPIITQGHGELVLGASQGHPFGRIVAQWHLGKATNALRQRLIRQGLKAGRCDALAVWQQRERTCRLAAVVVEQTKIIGGIHACIASGGPCALLRQEVAEEPLDRAQRSAVDDRALSSRDRRRQITSLPCGVVVESPQVSLFGKSTNKLGIQPNTQQAGAGMFICPIAWI